MEKKYKSSDYAHVLRLAVILVGAVALGLLVRGMFLPDTMGQYGHYRGSDLVDQRNVEIRSHTNESCYECHRPIRLIHKAGVHKTVSCEFCHGPYADHVKDDKYVAKMPVTRGMEIKTLCLRCHNKIIRARPEESIKVVAMPQHLEEKKVNVEHNCNQCHMVHDPLLWIKAAYEMMGMEMKEEKK
ncbi:hypothetical protein UWK_02289 [Desulfocapsa sulfexigens DSM 10523]|uniref:Uncharacterized protein n=1 Tax=Desulfocapsa sulfexigens (strain DSM 10523 / SB164P1) TaxID=1167006 RepID=M1NGS3_DESSD|nr:cytochrome c3 family protein [Desulfocapsa sulfexigens]AGF78829.1 hypothetical protein UWK_02289 [Desulfocapsa sulfexigens DSM 10523]